MMIPDVLPTLLRVRSAWSSVSLLIIAPPLESKELPIVMKSVPRSEAFTTYLKVRMLVLVPAE
ncbi:hypothetical protein D3C85_1854670 [compost metagenome]